MFRLKEIRSLRNSGHDGQPFYFACCVLLVGAYLFVGYGLPYFGYFGTWFQEALFGFNQLKALGLPLTCVGLVLPLIVVLLGRQLSPEATTRVRFRCQRIFASTFFRIALTLLAIVVFYLLRNEYLNPDAIDFGRKFARDVPIKGAHVVHDEMWELYVHSRIWFYTHAMWNWSVNYSYQVASAFAGGVFVLLLMYYCSRLVPEKPTIAFLLCMCGGYMQLFFGDVENYTLTVMWIMGYFLASIYFIEGRTSIVVPSVLLAIALTFHLLAGFFIPSLLYLYWLAWQRGAKRAVAVAILASTVIGCSTLLFFHFHHLPIENLWYRSHAFGHGKTIVRSLLRPSPRYYFDIVNLAFLLVPAFIFLPPLLFFKRIEWNPINVHLLIATVVMIGFVLFWHASLGVYADWNLFSAAALPVSFLVWRNVLTEKNSSLLRSVGYLGWLFFMHSYTWIVSNHFSPYYPTP